MIIAAACYPDAQARVQEELDDVVGRDRGTSGIAMRCIEVLTQHPAPTFADWDMLPHLHAFMLEALRWRPVAPLGRCPVAVFIEGGAGAQYMLVYQALHTVK